MACVHCSDIIYIHVTVPILAHIHIIIYIYIFNILYVYVQTNRESMSFAFTHLGGPLVVVKKYTLHDPEIIPLNKKGIFLREQPHGFLCLVYHLYTF